MIESYLGEGTTMIKNKAGDPIFTSADKLRRIRFDFNRPKPLNNPHMHVEYLFEDEWIGVKPGQIYPFDVPHN